MLRVESEKYPPCSLRLRVRASFYILTHGGAFSFTWPDLKKRTFGTSWKSRVRISTFTAGAQILSLGGELTATATCEILWLKISQAT